jgi:prepilin-type N-terminal cleavage/methylation domain-containing protein
MHSGIGGRKGAGSRGGAFTLVELMIVLTILAILGATIVPQFASTYQDVVLRAAGRELVAALNLSYSLAVSRQVRHRLLFDTASGRWRVESVVGESGESGAASYSPVTDVPRASGRIDPKVKVRIVEPADPLRPGSRETRSTAGARPAAEDRNRDRSASPPEVILFRPDGTADPREIVLRDRAGFGIALRVDAVTARVRILALEREEAP